MYQKPKVVRFGSLRDLTQHWGYGGGSWGGWGGSKDRGSTTS